MKNEPLLEKIIEAPAEALEKTIEVSHDAVASITKQKPLQQASDYWHMLGPGLTTGAADDDPAGIATYSQTGAQYGFQLLWLAGFTFPLMAVVQEMCARIGIVTGRGLAANIRLRFPKWVLYACTVLLFAANAFNIGADLGAMAKTTQLVLPHASSTLLLIGFALISLLLQIFTTYETYARYLKWMALILLSYVFSAAAMHLNWIDILHKAVTPSITWSKDSILLVCAILGTTISPYLFFWQTSQEVEEKILQGETTIAERQVVSKKHISDMRIDVWSGMFISNMVMFFIIATCAATLFTNGTTITTAADAAQALRPFAGDSAFLLFTLGVIGTGMLSIPVLAGSASYALSESFGWKQGLYRRLNQAYAFYGVIILSMLIGLGLNFIGLDPVKALIYSAVGNGFVAPLVLVLIVMISSNKKVMGEHVNHPFTTWVGWAVVGIMALASIATIISFF